MAAIITEQFRINSRKRLIEDITNNSNNYYIAIGKEEDWAEKLLPISPTSPFPAGTVGDAAEVRNNISALFKIEGSKVSTMLPNYVIQSDRSYKVYNPYDPTCFYASSSEFPCFVTSRLDSQGGGDGDQVYLCIGKDHDATVANNSYNRIGSPAIGNINGPGIFNGDDGYRWLYMGKYTAANIELNNGAFVSYDFNQDALNGVPLSVASPGLIHGFHIINAGTGLINGTNVAIKVEIIGDWDGVNTILSEQDAKVDIVDGKIVKITLNEDITDGNTYKYWSKATARITTAGYTSTRIVPIVSPLVGYEVSLETTLPSWYVGVGADTINAQYVPAGTTYRQISILKNPKTYANVNLNAATVDRTHRSFTSATELTLGGESVGQGWQLKQGDYSVGVISSVEIILGVYHYYYSNSIESGLLDINDAESLTIIAPATLDLTPDELILLDTDYALTANTNLYDRSSGEVIFIDNRGAVTREQGQNEEIKIIIQL